MEQHGKNPSKQVIAIIPARYESVRLAGKLLLPLAGKPLILHTLGQVSKACSVDKIIVATDDRRIFQIVSDSGIDAMMTSGDHQSGTDRIAEAAADFPDESIIVNVQADEPLIDPETIDSAIKELLEDETLEMSTCSETIGLAGDVLDPNVVKVVTDSNGLAIYFSRSPIPFPRNDVIRFGSLENALANKPALLKSFRKHIGIYVYRHGFLKRFASAPVCGIERIEMLEQLRALELGCRIKVIKVKGSAPGIDTVEDYERVKKLLESPI